MTEKACPYGNWVSDSYGVLYASVCWKCELRYKCKHTQRLKNSEGDNQL